MKKVGRSPALHHKLIIHSIEKLLSGELSKRNLMLLMPPGSAKSSYTSVLLPAFYLNSEQYPTELMLACSYSYTLIEGFGRHARDIVSEESNILGVSLSKTSSAAGDWRTTKGGGYFCAGVNAGIAGHRARLGLIDDYLGSEEEADSQVIRDKNWSWYWNDFVPRLLPNANQILIANRRHEDDLVGRLLQDEGDSWFVIRLPMLAEQDDPLGRSVGDRLWPEWFTEEQVRQAKKLPRTWAGLYQQRPAPEEGNFFNKNTIIEYKLNELPKNLRMYAASDWALRKGDQNDKTCHMIGGVDEEGRLWIVDWFWGKLDTFESTQKMFDLNRQYKPAIWWHGRENITGSIGPFIYQKMRDDGEYIVIDELSEARDKVSKAQAIKGWMGAKMVMFPSFLPEWGDALHEILTFPGGTHDDFVDTLAKFGQGLNLMNSASIKSSKKSLEDILNPRLTWGWMERSSKRREQELIYN